MPTPSLNDICNALWVSGHIAEYQAMKQFILERDKLYEELWQLRVPLPA